MKSPIAALAAFAALPCLVAAAGGFLSAGPLAAPEFADTEASTNAPLSFAESPVRRLEFSLVLAATPSNNVQASFGRDADGDGKLGALEAGMSVGWDCGKWALCGDGAMARMVAMPASTNGVKRLEWDLRIANGRPKALSVRENGIPLDFGLGENLPLWLFSREWNTFRLDVRGSDWPDERFRAAAEVAGAFLKVR